MAELEEQESGDIVDPSPNCLVGRALSCELRLPDPVVSNEHAMLYWSGAAWEVRDLGSRNGTFVNGQRLEAGGRRTLTQGARLGFGTRVTTWRLVDDGPPSSLRPSRVRLATEGTEESFDLATTGLRFEVTADEEHVQVMLVDAERHKPLPTRAFHYLLLTLARARLRDRAAHPERTSEHGWLYADSVADSLGMDVERMNVDVHRARKQFSEQGVSNAAQIVERRSSTHQLRIGVAHLEVLVL